MKQLHQMVGSRAAQMFPGLVTSYIEDAAKLLAEASIALEKQDADSLRRAAHTLKSTSANFGAWKVSTTCQELEAQAKQGQLAGAAALLAQIHAEQTSAEQALRQMGRSKRMAMRSIAQQGVVLVVDDNALNRTVLGVSLEEDGYRVDYASNGLQALEKLHQTSYDVMLLNLLMPEPSVAWRPGDRRCEAYTGGVADRLRAG